MVQFNQVINFPRHALGALSAPMKAVDSVTQLGIERVKPTSCQNYEGNVAEHWFMLITRMRQKPQLSSEGYVIMY